MAKKIETDKPLNEAIVIPPLQKIQSTNTNSSQTTKKDTKK